MSKEQDVLSAKTLLNKIANLRYFPMLPVAFYFIAQLSPSMSIRIICLICCSIAACAVVYDSERKRFCWTLAAAYTLIILSWLVVILIDPRLH